MKKQDNTSLFRAYLVGRKLNELLWHTSLACLGCSHTAESRVNELLDELSIEVRSIVPTEERDILQDRFHEAKKVLPALLLSAVLADARLEAAEKVRKGVLDDRDPEDVARTRQQACEDVLGDVSMEIGRLAPGLIWHLDVAVSSGSRAALALGRAADGAVRPLGQYEYLYDPEPLSKVNAAVSKKGRTDSGKKGKVAGPSSREMLEDSAYWPNLYLANKAPEPGSMPLPSGWIGRIEQLWVELYPSLGGDKPAKPLTDPQWARLSALDAVAKVDKATKRALSRVPRSSPAPIPASALGADDALIRAILEAGYPLYIQFRPSLLLLNIDPRQLHKAVKDGIIPSVRGDKVVQGGQQPLYISLQHARRFVEDRRIRASDRKWASRG